MPSSAFTLRIILNMPPKAQKETQFANGHAYTPAEKVHYMMKASKELRPYRRTFKGIKFLSIRFIFVCPRPKACPKDLAQVKGLWKNQITFYKPSRPDLDNYEKVIQDCLSLHVIRKVKNKAGESIMSHKGAGVVDDDSFFVHKVSTKVYARIGEKPHIKIKISALDPIYES
jgi:Holliday junction resolvase RusA-like endonuclease